jgi:serine/threonine-protein kinase
MSETDDDLAKRAQARVGQMLCRKYRIERVLGIGGMAFVYVAKHRNGHRVAIKMLLPELTVRPDIRKRFLQEGHAANAVGHPGAVVVSDDDVAEDGAAFLVMELLQGRSVEDLWRENGGVLAPKTVLAIARDLCDVLAAAHAVGIIHRDLKPANLFLTTDGRVKVLDFGLARVRDAPGVKATASGLVFGTPAFLPPEQAAGRTSQIDARTDIWAVGATCFTLLTGRTVHEGESAQNLVVLAATTPPRPIAQLLPDIHPGLGEVVDRALAFDRESRWQTARQMQSAISAVIDEVAGESGIALTATSDVFRALTTTPIASDVDTIGTHTSIPVSSAAPVPPDRTRISPIARIAKRVVATIPMSTVVWRKRVAIAASAGVALAMAIVISALRLESAPAQTMAPSEPTAAVSMIASRETTTELPPPVETAALSAKPAAIKAPGHKTLRPLQVSSPRPKEKTPDCAQEFTFDATGKKIWKPECVQ